MNLIEVLILKAEL